MAYNWIPVLGELEQHNDDVIFKGGTAAAADGRMLVNIGNFICDQRFGGGELRGVITFTASQDRSACGYILYYQPSTKAFIVAILGGTDLCSVKSYSGHRWSTHGAVGSPEQLRPNREYDLRVSAVGSRVDIRLDGVEVLSTNLPFPLPFGQPGIWAMGRSDTVVSGFEVLRRPPTVFVVMQFTPPYNDLYNDVIRPVCEEELGLTVVRADDIAGPGLIVADIARHIVEANVVVADISPRNPNVYYEVGYSHALRKPTVLIAEKPTELPFDVSPFRVLFYENTIGGKLRIEQGLRKHLTAVLAEWSVT